MYMLKVIKQQIYGKYNGTLNKEMSNNNTNDWISKDGLENIISIKT